MQSRPTEISNQFTTVSPSESSTTDQYGGHNDLRGHHVESSIETGSGSASSDTSGEDIPPRSSGQLEQHGTDESSGRRLSPVSTPRNKSPVDRIIEHERSTTPSPRRTRGQGPEFRVIPRTSPPSAGSIKLEDFPNGTLLLSQNALLKALITYRGLDTFILAPTSVLSGEYCLGNTPLPRLGHYSSCLEIGFCPILSWFSNLDNASGKASGCQKC